MKYSKEQINEFVSKIKNNQMSIYDIPEDDEETYETFKKGQSNFTFQFGSQLSRSILSRMKNLNSVYDLASVTALGRPGPMKEIDHFIRLSNNEPTEDDLKHKMPVQFEPYFKNSYGLFIFQEQFIEVCRHVAGFNWSEADEARKAVGKKNLAFIQAIKERFFAGCIKAGVSEQELEEFWVGLLDFASYSFNLSHAYCYAKLGYVTCFFLTHYPAEYLSSIMNKNSGDKDKLQEAIECCKERNINVIVPDILKSQMGFSAIDENNITYGLSAIKGIGKSCEPIIKTRQNYRIESIKDFFNIYAGKELGENKLKTLIEAGALDSLCKKDELIKTRSILLYNFDNIFEEYKPKKHVKANQMSLFETNDLRINVPQNNDITWRRYRIHTLQLEKELLGTYVSHNPIDYIEGEDDELTSEIIDKYTNIKRKGIITGIKKVTTKAGKQMCFVSMSGKNDNLELIVFPKTYDKIKDVLKVNFAINAKISVEKKEKEDKYELSYILQDCQTHEI